MKKPNYLVLLPLFLHLHTVHSQESKGLKSIFKQDFYIGTALSENQILKKSLEEDRLIRKEFSSITAENSMKAMYIHPEENNFNFKTTDVFVAYGQKNKQFIHGHTLIWHSQMAPWMQNIKDSTTLRAFMKNHISTIVGRYKGRVDSWDVVNEALNDDGSLRESLFYKLLGEKYLTESFLLAQKADPKVDLYYNDYSIEDSAKRAGAIRLIKNLKKQGAKIDGIGIQGHWNLQTPSVEEIEKSIIEYAAQGLKVAFTELDISVLPNPWDLKGADVNQNFEGSAYMNPYPETLPQDIQTKLAQRYASIFKLFLKHKDKISRITFWGVHDGQSWLNDWPIKKRTNYPLLFDKNLKPKKAYQSVIDSKKQNKQP